MEEKLDFKKFAEMFNVDYATLPQEELKEMVAGLEKLMQDYPQCDHEDTLFSIAEIKKHIKWVTKLGNLLFW